MISHRSILTLIIFYSVFHSGTVLANNGLNPVSWKTSLHVTAHPGLDSQTIDSLYSTRLFLDVDYLDRWIGAIGIIQQHYSLTDDSAVDNQIFFSQLGHNWYPSNFNGKMSVQVDYYYGNDLHFIDTDTQIESATTLTSSGFGYGPGSGSQTGPGPGSQTGSGSGSGSDSDSGSGSGSGSNGGDGNNGGPGPGPGTGNIQITLDEKQDTLWIFNPRISYLNQAKTFYMDVAMSHSEYQTDPSEFDLSTTQLAPAIGFVFNQQFDWLQLRYFGIRLSSDARTPGVRESHALSTSWTHWLANRPKPGFESVTLNLLVGERLFAVEQDVRIFYYTANQQKGSLIAGLNGWLNSNIEFSGYIGFERYEDIKLQDEYNDIFITFNLSIPLN